MENASKALLMAGGILIALLILGSLVMMFTSLQDYQNNENNLTKQSQIAKFNDQFEPFAKENLSLMELKSIYNKIESNNIQHPEYKIDHNILDSNILPAEIRENFKKGNEEFRKIDDKYKQNMTFKGEIVSRNGEGRSNQ